MGYFKTCGTLVGYPTGVPVGVPLYCSIWTSLCNILMSNCEDHVARMKFREETWQGESLVFALLTLEVHSRKT